MDQLSGGVIGASLASAASFSRSALLMYRVLFLGASLALAFLALAFNNWFIFLRRFMVFCSACQFSGWYQLSVFSGFFLIFAEGFTRRSIMIESFGISNRIAVSSACISMSVELPTPRKITVAFSNFL